MDIVLTRRILCFIVLLRSLASAQGEANADTGLSYGLLIPAKATMQRAWEIPKNPLLDSVNGNSPEMEQIRYGYRVFTSTALESPASTGNSLSCSNCHLNAGQREKALPLAGIAGVYPEYNKRSAKEVTLEDRIIECFNRSIDASRINERPHAGEQPESLIVRTKDSKDVRAIAAYIGWLSHGSREKPPWRGQNAISPGNIIPLERLDTARGHALFADKCVTCHGADGQGVFIGDKKAGPLWGSESWNDGAGAARIYTLAGIIRYMMPYLDPGSLTDEEAQEIAAFINSQARPVYPYKSLDYPGSAVPADAVYYPKERRK